MKTKAKRLFVVFFVSLSLTISLILVLGGGLVQIAHAANFTVTRADDPTPDGCNPSDCSLREAVIAANTNPGADTIFLSSVTYNLTQAGPGEDGALTGDLDISDALILSGTGSTVIDGGGLDRVLHLFSNDFTISGITIRNGSTDEGGGGLYIDDYVSGTIKIMASTFESNTASHGGGLANFSIFTTTIIISNSAFENNSANDMWMGYGGAILDFSEVAFYDISGSSFINNTASLDGGGIDYSALSGGHMNITNTTFSGNNAGESGGGILNANSTKAVNLNNVTIFGNTADSDGDGSGDGGGISIYAASTMGTYNVANSIIAGNYDDSPGNEAPDCAGPSGTIVSTGYNLIGNSDGCNWVSTTGDMAGSTASPIDPNLGTLTGRPAYHPLNSNSLAIDAGNPAVVGGAFPACGAIDQRGQMRPLDGNSDTVFRCDIGAYELNSDFSPPDFPTIDPDTGTALITPTLGITLSTRRPTFDWHDAVDAGGGTVVSYTLTITSSRDTISVQEAAANVTANQSSFTPASNLLDAVYTWTVRAYDLSGNVSAPLPEATFAIAGSEEIYLPVVIKN